MPIRYAELMGEITGLPPLPVAEMGPPRLTPLARPLREARVIIVTSAGVHLDSDPPFNHPNDMTYRRIPHATPPERLRPSHPTPVQLFWRWKSCCRGSRPHLSLAVRELIATISCENRL